MEDLAIAKKVEEAILEVLEEELGKKSAVMEYNYYTGETKKEWDFEDEELFERYLDIHVKTKKAEARARGIDWDELKKQEKQKRLELEIQKAKELAVYERSQPPKFQVKLAPGGTFSVEDINRQYREFEEREAARKLLDLAPIVRSGDFDVVQSTIAAPSLVIMPNPEKKRPLSQLDTAEGIELRMNIYKGMEITENGGSANYDWNGDDTKHLQDLLLDSAPGTSVLPTEVGMVERYSGLSPGDILAIEEGFRKTGRPISFRPKEFQFKSCHPDYVFDGVHYFISGAAVEEDIKIDGESFYIIKRKSIAPEYGDVVMEISTTGAGVRRYKFFRKACLRGAIGVHSFVLILYLDTARITGAPLHLLESSLREERVRCLQVPPIFVGVEFHQVDSITHAPRRVVVMDLNRNVVLDMFVYHQVKTPDDEDMQFQYECHGVDRLVAAYYFSRAVQHHRVIGIQLGNLYQYFGMVMHPHIINSSEMGDMHFDDDVDTISDDLLGRLLRIRDEYKTQEMNVYLTMKHDKNTWGNFIEPICDKGGESHGMLTHRGLARILGKVFLGSEFQKKIEDFVLLFRVTVMVTAVGRPDYLELVGRYPFIGFKTHFTLFIGYRTNLVALQLGLALKVIMNYDIVVSEEKQVRKIHLVRIFSPRRKIKMMGSSMVDEDR